MTLQNWNDDCEFYKRPSKKLVTNNDDLVNGKYHRQGEYPFPLLGLLLL